MPQLWIETWVTQYFWLLVIMFFFHFYMVNKVIPSIATIFKIRKTLNVRYIYISDKTESSNNVTLNSSEFKVVLPNITPTEIKIK